MHFLNKLKVVAIVVGVVMALAVGTGVLLYGQGDAKGGGKGDTNSGPKNGAAVNGDDRGITITSRLGYGIGRYLTIEGSTDGSGKGGNQILMVDTINGSRLKAPLGIRIEGVKLPVGERCVFNGFESGQFIGIPHEVLAAEKMGAPQAVWQFSHHFVVTSVKAPESLKFDH